jgi:hypothetical protein
MSTPSHSTPTSGVRFADRPTFVAPPPHPCDCKTSSAPADSDPDGTPNSTKDTTFLLATRAGSDAFSLIPSPEVEGILRQDDGLDRHPYLHFYKYPQVEDLFLLATGKDRLTLTVASFAFAIAFTIIAFVRFYPFPDGALYFWIHQLSALVFLAIGILNHRLTKRYDAADAKERILIIKLHERYCLLQMAVSGVLAIEVYSHQKFCMETSSEPQAEAYRLCTRELYPYLILFQLLPMFLFELRHILAIPLVVSDPILMFFVGRPLAPIDTLFEMIGKFFFQSCFAIGCSVGLWYLSLYRRRHFEAWVEMRKNQRLLQKRRSDLDTVLRNILPHGMIRKLLLSQAPFEATADASICVCRISDYFQWSHQMTPHQLVNAVDSLYSLFDEGCRNRFKLTKAKTLGDRYISTDLCSTIRTTPTTPQMQFSLSSSSASGYASESNSSSAGGSMSAASSALEVVRFGMWQIRTASRLSALTFKPIELCVGVQTGPTFGGILGTQTLWFELYGDAFEDATHLADLAPPNTFVAGEGTIDLVGQDIEIGPHVQGLMEESEAECRGYIVKSALRSKAGKNTGVARLPSAIVPVEKRLSHSGSSDMTASTNSGPMILDLRGGPTSPRSGTGGALAAMKRRGSFSADMNPPEGLQTEGVARAAPESTGNRGHLPPSASTESLTSPTAAPATLGPNEVTPPLRAEESPALTASSIGQATTSPSSLTPTSAGNALPPQAPPDQRPIEISDRARHRVVRQRLLRKSTRVPLSNSLVATMKVVDGSFWNNPALGDGYRRMLDSPDPENGGGAAAASRVQGSSAITNATLTGSFSGTKPTPLDSFARGKNAAPSDGTTDDWEDDSIENQSFFGLHEAVRVQSSLQEYHKRVEDGVVFDLRFPTTFLEAKYVEYLGLTARAENRQSTAPYLFAFVASFILWPWLVEGVATIAGTTILSLDLAIGIATVYFLSHGVATSSRLRDFIVVTLLHAACLLGISLQGPSITNTSLLFAYYPLTFFATHQLLRLPWWAIGLHIFAMYCALVTISYLFVPGWNTLSSGAITTTMFLGFMAFGAKRQEKRRRDFFSDVALSKLLLEAESNEFSLQRALLHMVVPAPMVNAVLEKSEGKRKAIIESLGDVCVAVIRLETLTSSLAPLMNQPMRAFEMLEKLYEIIESAIAPYKVIERVHTVGDEMLLAGPLTEHMSLKLQENSVNQRVHSVGSRKLQRLEEDEVLTAAIALLDVAKILISSIEGRVSLMLHCDSAYAAVVGTQPATFSVLGQCTRKAEALLRALPPGMHGITSTFRKLLQNGQVILPRDTQDFRLTEAQRWRLRGAGVAWVHRMRLPGTNTTPPFFHRTPSSRSLSLLGGTGFYAPRHTPPPHGSVSRVEGGVLRTVSGMSELDLDPCQTPDQRAL